jgi:hypothetical protein
VQESTLNSTVCRLRRSTNKTIWGLSQFAKNIEEFKGFIFATCLFSIGRKINSPVHRILLYSSQKQNLRLRPYYPESTASRPICAVKLDQALLVLRWETTWEPGVLVIILQNFVLQHKWFTFLERLRPLITPYLAPYGEICASSAIGRNLCNVVSRKLSKLTQCELTST